MDVAALILSTLSLVISTGLVAVFLGKNYFSSHVIQYKPVDDLFGNSASSVSGKPMDEIYREFDQLTPEEEEYFKKQKM